MLIAPFPDLCLFVPFFRLMFDKLESHLRCLEGLKQDINTDVFKVIIKSKIPEDIMRQLNLQKGSKTE